MLNIIIISLLLNLILFNKFFFSLKIIPLDKPLNKIHKTYTPLYGGVALLCNLALLYFLNNHFSLVFTSFNSIIYFSVLILFIGYFDDFSLLSINARLVLYILALYLFLSFNNDFIIEFIYIESLKVKFSLNVLFENNLYIKILITILFFFIFLNASNFYDGSNGQIGFFYFFIFLIISIKDQTFIFFLIFLIFFLIFNLQGKIFMGNSGTFAISFIIGAILTNLYKTGNISIEEIFLLMWPVGLDFIRIFFSRIFSKQNPLIGDLNHIHHKIIRKYDFISMQILLVIFNISPFLLYVFFKNFVLSLILSLILYLVLINDKISKNNE